MRGRKILAMIMLCLLTIDIPIFSVTMVSADPVYKQIQGVVNPNSTTGVRAYDPVQNGFVYYYIQNRTNEGNGTDPMETNPSPPPVFDYYDPEIHLGISDWQVGDECILVIDREYGNYSTNDHAGYIAFTNVTLDGLVGVQMAPTTELQKITTPTFVGNGTGYIEITWDPLNDTNGLIEGYKIYRSTTNGTVWGDDDWTLVGGSVNAPLNVTNFNDTSVIGGTTYYYSVKVVFTGYQNNDPGQVDNYQNQYFGEGSVPMNTFTNGGIPGAPTDLRVHKGGEEWAGSSGDIVLNWTAPVIDFGFLVKNIVYYDMDITDGFQYTSFIEFDPNASAGGDPDWCILPGWDADSNNYSFIVRTTGDIQGGLENLTGTNIGYKYIMILQKNPGPGT